MPSKSIAIPSRRKAGGKSGRTESAEALPPAPIMPARRRAVAGPSRGTPVHKFAMGEVVMVSQPSRLSVPQAGLYVVVRTLPHEGGPLLYRVRSELDAHERVVSEADISLPDTGAPRDLP